MIALANSQAIPLDKKLFLTDEKKFSVCPWPRPLKTYILITKPHLVSFAVIVITSAGNGRQIRLFSQGGLSPLGISVQL
jgi:hypothetical protein